VLEVFRGRSSRLGTPEKNMSKSPAPRILTSNNDVSETDAGGDGHRWRLRRRRGPRDRGGGHGGTGKAAEPTSDSKEMTTRKMWRPCTGCATSRTPEMPSKKLRRPRPDGQRPQGGAAPVAPRRIESAAEEDRLPSRPDQALPALLRKVREVPVDVAAPHRKRNVEEAEDDVEENRRPRPSGQRPQGGAAPAARR
jgi:hypothetical protein